MTQPSDMNQLIHAFMYYKQNGNSIKLRQVLNHINIVLNKLNEKKAA